MTTNYATCQCQHSCTHRSVVHSTLSGVSQIIWILMLIHLAVLGVVGLAALWLEHPLYAVAVVAGLTLVLVRRHRVKRRVIQDQREAQWAERAAYYQQERIRKAKEAPLVLFDEDTRKWERELTG